MNEHFGIENEEIVFFKDFDFRLPFSSRSIQQR
jgi:hypothetical protein